MKVACSNERKKEAAAEMKKNKTELSRQVGGGNRPKGEET